MKYSINILLISILFLAALSGQGKNNQIMVSKDENGKDTYLYNGKYLNKKEVTDLVILNYESAKVYYGNVNIDSRKKNW